MQATQVEALAILRTLVGYLGERDQHGWWQSSFFGPGSRAFLAPVFAKTQLLAQCNGVTRAAALVHDERIGVGHVYHLFRLPEDLEQSLHHTLHDPDFANKVGQLVTNQATALHALQAMSEPTTAERIGPTRIGDIQQLHTLAPWAVTAAHYAQAFARGVQSYPYFSTPAS